MFMELAALKVNPLASISLSSSVSERICFCVVWASSKLPRMENTWALAPSAVRIWAS